jgi:hypothetical protein
MNTIRRARDDAGLYQILNYVHDRPYDIADINFEKEAGQVSIPVQLRSVRKERRLGGLLKVQGSTRGALIFRHITDMSIVDKAETGQGDIATISFSDGRLVVEGGLPVTITMNTNTIDVELVLPEDADLT